MYEGRSSCSYRQKSRELGSINSLNRLPTGSRYTFIEGLLCHETHIHPKSKDSSSLHLKDLVKDLLEKSTLTYQVVMLSSLERPNNFFFFSFKTSNILVSTLFESLVYFITGFLVLTICPSPIIKYLKVQKSPGVRKPTYSEWRFYRDDEGGRTSIEQETIRPSDPFPSLFDWYWRSEKEMLLKHFLVKIELS